MQKNIYLFLLLLLTCAACKEKWDVNAPPKEVWVVYGMLRSYDSIHYVRISKAFLSEKDAILTAKEADYSVKGLQVVLSDGQNQYIAKELNDVPKFPQNGDFYPFITVYQFITPPLATQKTYHLTITSPNDPNFYLKAHTTIPPRPIVYYPRLIYDTQNDLVCPQEFSLADSSIISFNAYPRHYYNIHFYLNYTENDTLKETRVGTTSAFLADASQKYKFAAGTLLRSFQSYLSNPNAYYAVIDSPACNNFSDYFGVEVADLDSFLTRKSISENPAFSNFNDYRMLYSNISGSQEAVGIWGSVGVRRVPLHLPTNEFDSLRLHH